MNVEHVVADHLLPHPAGPLCHLQGELVQVGANRRPPQAAFPQQLVLDRRPLLRHVLEGVLLSLRVESEVGITATLKIPTCLNSCFACIHPNIKTSGVVLPLDAPCTAWSPGLEPQRCG